MILDTSAVIAVLREEPEAAAFLEIIENTALVRISVASYFEASVVIDSSHDPIASRAFDDFFRESRIVIEPVTEAQARLARAAYRDFGRGGGHPAGLNFGDCFSYALAKDLGEPLLYKGNDFTHTDVMRAVG